MEAAQASPARAAELEARIEGADSAHGLVFMALLCEAVEPVRARLAMLTQAAADPPAEAARLIQAEGLPLGVEVEDGPRGITAVAAATVFGNAPVLRFFLAQPGVDPGGWAVHGQTLVSFAAMVCTYVCDGWIDSSYRSKPWLVATQQQCQRHRLPVTLPFLPSPLYRHTTIVRARRLH